MRGTRKRLSRSLPLIALTLAGAGCDRPAGSDPAPPRLALHDSIVLEESDTLYVGRPADFAVDPRDGSFYVSDAFSGRVVRFDRQGVPVASYGGKGSGPGEFQDAGQVVVLDSVVAAADDGRGILNLYHRSSGRYLGMQRYDGVLRSATRGADGAVWLGAQSLEQRSGVVRWNPATGETRRLVALPGEYVESQPIGGIFNGVFVAPWADTLLVGFAGSAALRLAARDGTTLDTIPVPAVHRKGVPADFPSRVEKLPFPEIFGAISVLFDVHRLPDGRFGLVHYDQAIDASGNVTSKVFVSLLSANRRRACVDAQVPAGRAAQPKTAFRGDTLFVLDQDVEGERAETTVRRYTLDDAPCGWIPLPG